MHGIYQRIPGRYFRTEEIENNANKMTGGIIYGRNSEVYELVVKGKAKKVAPAVEAALEEGCEPVAILNEGMIAAMDEVGAKFKNGEIFVPEMLVAAKAMKNGVVVLKPYLSSRRIRSGGQGHYRNGCGRPS